LKSRELFVFSVIYFQCFANGRILAVLFLRTLRNEAHQRLWARKSPRRPSDSEASIIFGKGATSAKPCSTRGHL
jgi:hypothetical protein